MACAINKQEQQWSILGRSHEGHLSKHHILRYDMMPYDSYINHILMIRFININNKYDEKCVDLTKTIKLLLLKIGSK